MSIAPKQAKHRLSLACGTVVCGVLVCLPATAANDDAGKKKADEACAACHGPEGNKPATAETPRLAGQQYDYLVQVLTEYHSGKRNNAIMTAMAKPLTEKEIRDLAVYFSEQPGLITKR